MIGHHQSKNVGSPHRLGLHTSRLQSEKLTIFENFINDGKVSNKSKYTLHMFY